MASLINMSGGSLLGKSMPYDAEIEYLESTGTQYIDSGIIATTGTWFDTKVFFNGDGCPFSSRNSSTLNRYGVSANSAGLFVNNGRSTPYQWEVVAKNAFINKSYSLRMENNELFVDGISKGEKGTSFNAKVNLTIFALNENNNIIQYLHGRIYYVRFYNSTGSIRDFIPVRVGQVGYMYDRVSGQLFGNSGTGNFILGPDI